MQKTRIVGVKNLKERVALINYFIQQGKKDAQIRQLASSILSQKCGEDWCIPEKEWESEVEAIFMYVRRNVRYTLDPWELELFQKARRSLENKTADCDDQVILAGAMLQAVGYPLRLIVVDTGKGGYSHIYMSVGLPPMNPKKWLPFDLTATTEPLGWEVPNYSVKRKRIFEIQD